MTDTDLILQWSVAAVVGAVLVARRQFTPFHPPAVYWVFHVFEFCIRPTLVHVFAWDEAFLRLGNLPEPVQVRLALLLSSAGLVVFTAGFSLATLGAPMLFSGDRYVRSPGDSRAFAVVALLCGIPGLYALLVALAPELGLPKRMATSGETVDLIASFHVLLAPVAIGSLVASGWRWWSIVFFAGTLYSGTLVRVDVWWLLLVAMSLPVLWLWERRRRFPPARVLIPSALVLAVGEVVLSDPGYFPSLISRGESRAKSDAEQPTWQERLDTPGLTLFENLTHATTLVPEQNVGFTSGAQYLPPRLDPAVSYTTTVVQPGTADQAAIAIPSPSIIGDGWISAGWTGVITTALLAGAVMGAVFRGFVRHHESAGIATACVVAQASFVLFYRDGGIGPLLTTALMAAPLLLWHSLAAHFRIAHAAAQERENLRKRRELRRLKNLGQSGPETTEPEAVASTTGANSAVETPGETPPPPARPRPRWHEGDST